ncbi:hypothetical protein BSEPE_0423 [endosymbiont of Bathymodiolus septemdierum str. Myojin knoll]|uniref:Uncharacterized protein n=2 Tax=sulfur-oxidizing symbionts TaxID=32036 RepID=A0A0P0UQT2_9GAMM|nr:hypothetical protein BSEPE_0423 [endosymbiont of Bathymodiolus septemdierum str. Myojin knoll]
MLLKLVKIVALLPLFYFLGNATYAINTNSSKQKNMSSQILEITPDHIRQNWIFDTQVNSTSGFAIMKNAQEWQDFWHDMPSTMDTPNWVEGDVAVFIFLGKDLPGGTRAQLTIIDYQSEQDSATLFWQLSRDLNAISVTAFQDIWTVFILNSKHNPIFGKINNIVKTY